MLGFCENEWDDVDRDKYCFCHLVRQMGDGITWEMDSWIPKEYAVVGRILRLRTVGGEWEDGWWVKSAGEARESHLLPDPQCLHRTYYDWDDLEF